MSDEAGFLYALRENPGDDDTRLVYADWLEERGDPRGEYLRLEHQLRTIPARLAHLREGIDRDWIAAVFGRCRVVLVSYPPDRKIHAIKVVREITGVGLADGKTLVERSRAVIKDDITFEEADRIAQAFQSAAEVAVEPSFGK